MSESFAYQLNVNLVSRTRLWGSFTYPGGTVAAGDHTRYPHSDLRIVGIAKTFLHRDHLASVRLVINVSGAVVEQTGYAAYGEKLNTGLTTREGYIGKRYDEDTGLLYLNARYQDPAWGRFISPDDWDPTLPDVGTNRYAYARTSRASTGKGHGHPPLVTVANWTSARDHPCSWRVWHGP